MSSAILYAAIIAIWAGVLIPRWLRRDSSASSAEVSGVPGEQDGASAAAEAAEAEEPRRPRRRGRRRDGLDDRDDRHGDLDDRSEVPPDLGRRRVLSARRRLLGLLLVLAAGSGTLAGTRMAAWWVVVPPAIMLLGYLPLLRAAAQADAERLELGARARAGQDRAADYSRDVADPDASVAHVAPLAGRPAPAPGPEPVGLADEDDDELYDQYADARLRAVGD